MRDVPYFLSIQHYEAGDTAIQLRVLVQEYTISLDISRLELEDAYIAPDHIGAQVLINLAMAPLEQAIAEIGAGTPRCVGRTEGRHYCLDNMYSLKVAGTQ
jgi:hypothetical protein